MEAAIRPGRLADLPDINRVLLVLSKGVDLIRPTTFVAVVDGRVQGCGSVYYDQFGAGWLCNVAVDKSLRRQGVGRALVEACIDRAVDRRLSTLWLTTMFWNRGFYESLDFTFIPAADLTPAVRAHRSNKACMFMRRDLRDAYAKAPDLAIEGFG